MKSIFAFAVIAATLLVTPALAARTCLQQSLIYSWKALDDRTLIVEDKFHDKFRLSLMVPCQHLQFHENLGFRTFSNTALTCVAKGDEVISGTSIGPQHCPIKTIEPYTADMEKADKAAADAAKAATH
jgi:hypothetical protein